MTSFSILSKIKNLQKSNDPVNYVINCHYFAREISDFSLRQGTSEMFVPRKLVQLLQERNKARIET